MSGRPICRTCKVKCAQWRGLCRTCGRKAGLYVKTTFQAEQERVAKMQAKLAAATRVEMPPPQDPNTVVVDGVAYEIVFDGRVR